jgi:hypothetical protein
MEEAKRHGEFLEEQTKKAREFLGIATPPEELREKMESVQDSGRAHRFYDVIADRLMERSQMLLTLGKIAYTSHDEETGSNNPLAINVWYTTVKNTVESPAAFKKRIPQLVLESMEWKQTWTESLMLALRGEAICFGPSEDEQRIARFVSLGIMPGRNYREMTGNWALMPIVKTLLAAGLDVGLMLNLPPKRAAALKACITQGKYEAKYAAWEKRMLRREKKLMDFVLGKEPEKKSA